ncbi:hypothetical protein GWN42_30430 [candidate division KSB1 bacterium]|nr:hypothetical protein [candidate division KSB1 bacterium]
MTPYVETGGLDVQNQGCDETFCTYHLYVKVWLHNPWEEDSFTGAVKCEFWDDNYMLGDSVRENITINPRRSKELEFVEGYTTGFDAALSVECDIVTD